MKILKKSRKLILLVFFDFSASVLAAKEYKGTVVALAKDQLMSHSNAYDRGWTLKTARLGQIVKPTVFNSKGKAVFPGDTLVLGDATPWKAYYVADRINLAASKEKLKIAESIYKRYEDMSSTSAVSEQAFTTAKSSLAAAKGEYLNNIAVLKQGKIAAERFDIKSPFEGIVTAVKMGTGSNAGGPAFVEAIQLNPIGVKIKVPIEEQIKISREDICKVYVNGLDKPLGVFHIAAMLDPEYITFAVVNFPILKKNTILKDTGIPILREWIPVVNFSYDSISSKILAVPVDSIKKDAKGQYVWRAKGQKVMQPDKGIEYTFPIEKVYITPDDMIRKYTSYTKIKALKDAGNLAKYDLVLNNPPAELKDGEKVIYPENAYLLMPGDEVKVVVEKNTQDNRK